MKVKKQLRADGKKDYSITHEGKEYKAVRQESALFSCNGVEGSLQSIKSKIRLGLIQETEEPSTKDMTGMEMDEKLLLCDLPVEYESFETLEKASDELMFLIRRVNWQDTKEDKERKAQLEKAELELLRAMSCFSLVSNFN